MSKLKPLDSALMLVATALFVLFVPVTYCAEIMKIYVGLEPAPPLINDDGSGLIIDLLRDV